jgi:hypothetical protein
MDTLVPQFSFRQAVTTSNDEQRLCEICRSMTHESIRSERGFNHHQQATHLWRVCELENGCILCALMWTSLWNDDLSPLLFAQDERAIPTLSGMMYPGTKKHEKKNLTFFLLKSSQISLKRATRPCVSFRYLRSETSFA